MKLLETPLTGLEAVTAFLSTLKPKDGSEELWIKVGHSTFYRTDFNFQIGYLTYLEDETNTKSRVIRSEHKDFFNYVDKISKAKDGGVFYVPSQPQGLPLAECVKTSDDIVFEMDNGSYDEQLAKILKFNEITGLELSSMFTSGGKSIHGHIKLIEYVSNEQIIYLNRLITIALRADPLYDQLHQPARFPGFYRKEKNNYQKLLFVSKSAYTFDEVVVGLRKFFDYDLMEFPEDIPNDWWGDCLKKVLKAKDNEESKTLRLRKNLIHGLEGWLVWKESSEIIRKQKQALYESRMNGVKNFNGASLVDLVRQTCEEIEKQPFDHDEHEWDWRRSDTHARGRCLWHESTSGNSAWLDARGGWSFHCPTCTNQAPLDALAYWQVNKLQKNSKDETEEGADWVRQVKEMSGLSWVRDAREWLELNGVEVPDLELGSLLETAQKFPKAPELQIDEERSAEPGGWEEEIEKAVRVYVLQDRTSVKTRYAKKIREHFGISQGELNQIAIDVNVFNREEPELIGTFIGDTVSEIQAASQNKGERIIPSALYGLNRYLLKGYARGTKVVLGALSSTGKTAIALKEAYNISVLSGEPVTFFSAESPRSQLIYRLFSQITHIPLGRLFRGQLDEKDWDKLLAASVELSNCKLYIDGTPGISTSQIRQKLMRLSDQVGNPRAIFVDHLSKIAKPYPGNINASMEAISHDLSNIADELNTVGFWLCQFNRGHNIRQTKEPQLDDIRDSDAIVQDADIILMPYRPGVRDDKSDPEMMKLYVRKNRDGPLGDVKLRFRGEFVDIEDGENYSFDHVEEIEEELEDSPPEKKYYKKKEPKEDYTNVNYF